MNTAIRPAPFARQLSGHIAKIERLLTNGQRGTKEYGDAWFSAVTVYGLVNPAATREEAREAIRYALPALCTRWAE